MDNPLEKLVNDQIKEKTGLAIDAVLDRVPELRDLLQGKPVDLVITLQLKQKE